MAEYFSPGVYVEEYDNSPRAMEGVGTSTYTPGEKYSAIFVTPFYLSSFIP